MTKQTTNKQPLFKRIKPLGWLFIGFSAVIAVSLVVLAIQPLTYPIRSLPAGAEAKSTAPTITPYLIPTEAAAPTATPLPGGWTQGKSLNGNPVLVPPEDLKASIVAMFEAVVQCNYTDDATDRQLLTAPDKATACAQAQQSALINISLTNLREITKLGPVNPVQCRDLNTCTIARAKNGFFGAVLTDKKSCGIHYANGGCVYRGTDTGGLEPYLILIATVTRQEDGSWKISELNREKLPGPPPSP
jgi:hypothetical protein